MSELVSPIGVLSFGMRGRALLRETWRYLAVSVAALAVDYGLLVALTELGHIHYLTSSVLSYCTGAVLAYVLSVTLVFSHRRVTDRRLEFLAFFAIGLLGLAATQVMLVAGVDGLGLNYMQAKIVAIGVSFALNYLARRALLFTTAPAAT
jgi:putative flippase GtrA